MLNSIEEHAKSHHSRWQQLSCLLAGREQHGWHREPPADTGDVDRRLRWQYRTTDGELILTAAVVPGWFELFVCYDNKLVLFASIDDLAIGLEAIETLAARHSHPPSGLAM